MVICCNNSLNFVRSLAPSEDEIDIGRSQNMPDIVACPDFPAIRELSVKGSEVVKKVTHVGIELIVAVGR